MKLLEDLKKFERRNKKIVTLRNQGKTQQYCADLYGITRARVGAIEKAMRIANLK